MKNIERLYKLRSLNISLKKAASPKATRTPVLDGPYLHDRLAAWMNDGAWR